MPQSPHLNGSVSRANDEQDAQSESNASRPPIAALFLVKFDNRKGYTLTWHRSADDELKLDGVAEFKSLPSGLHHVQEDLVYFVHESYIGISTFLNHKDENADRKARMLAVGVLVRLEQGRLSKSWLHADGLKELAEQLAEKNNDDYSGLEKYWDQHQVQPDSNQQDVIESNGSKGGLNIDTNVGRRSSIGYQLRSAMTASSVSHAPTHSLPPHHPALALPDLVHQFGPLVFPLFRAALLRKRILLVGEAPVERNCNHVYNLSIISSIPRAVVSLIPIDNPSDIRLQTLFSVGVPDIPFLSDHKSRNEGWIATTTDDVLCTKPELFDLLVMLPSKETFLAKSRAYPRLIQSDPELSKSYPKYGIRASQRDARRYVTLKKALASIPPSLPSTTNARAAATSEAIDDSESQADGPETVPEIDGASITSSVSSTFSRKSIVEPQSWSRIAYTSLLWWASAGDRRAGLTEVEEGEDDQDLALLATEQPTFRDGDDLENAGTDQDGPDEGHGAARSREFAVVAAFQQMSNSIFSVLNDCVIRSGGPNESKSSPDQYFDDPILTSPSRMNNFSQQSDLGHAEQEQHEQADGDNPEDGGSNVNNQTDTQADQPLLPDNTNPIDVLPIVEISSEDVSSMGLDIWSESDRQFVLDMVEFWWGRKARVTGARIECCGVRVLRFGALAIAVAGLVSGIIWGWAVN